MAGPIDLGNSLSRYFKKVHALLTQKPPVVTLSDNALKVGGTTLTDLQTQSTAFITPHTANKANPHGLTPEQLDSYTSETFKAMIEQRLGSGIIPISRYGDLSYIPPGISGSFEGATTVKVTGGVQNSRESYSFQLEDNGTLVFLRNGTNGSTFGVYYGYVLDAAQAFAGRVIKFTNRKYNPPFVPAGQSVQYLYQGGTSVLAGRLGDGTSTGMKNCFIALTNTTLDDINHVGVFLDPKWEDILTLSECVIVKDKLWILYNQYSTPSDGGKIGDPLEYQVYSIPIDSFNTAQLVEPVLETMGECTGWSGAKYNNGKLRFADKTETVNPNEPALIYHLDNDGKIYGGSRHIVGSGRIMTQCAISPDGTSLRVMTYQICRYSPPAGGLFPNQIAWSFTIDLNDLTAKVDPAQSPMTIRAPTPSTLAYSGTIVGSNLANLIANTGGQDYSQRTYLTETGLIFTSMVSYNPAGDDRIYRGQWNNFVSMFDALAVNNSLADKVPQSRLTLLQPRSFGSPIGDSMDGFRLVPNNQAIVMTRNALGPSRLVLFRLKPVGEPLTPNYSYKSVTMDYEYQGFAPTIERQDLNLGVNFPKLINQVFEMDATSYKVGGSVMSNTGAYNSRYLSINENLEISGSVSMTMDQLNKLRDEILVEGGLSIDNALPGASIEVIVPQHKAMPPYAVVTVAMVGGSRFVLMAILTLSSKTGVIASAKFASMINNFSLGVVGNTTMVNWEQTDACRQGTHWIYETETDFICWSASCFRFQTTSGGTMSSGGFYYSKATGKITSPIMGQRSPGISGSRVCAIPGYGVGTMYPADFTTKLTFRTNTKTSDTGTSWPHNQTDAESLCVVSQEVAQGWIVYFTDETPVLLNGTPGVLAQTQIDLNTIKADPRNTKFYVYVTYVNGNMQYRISATYLAETAYLLLIGTVTTGDGGITTMDVTKVTTFAGKRLSVSAVGQAIPVTAGLPSRESHISPDWF